MELLLQSANWPLLAALTGSLAAWLFAGIASHQSCHQDRKAVSISPWRRWSLAEVALGMSITFLVPLCVVVIVGLSENGQIAPSPSPLRLGLLSVLQTAAVVGLIWGLSPEFEPPPQIDPRQLDPSTMTDQTPRETMTAWQSIKLGAWGGCAGLAPCFLVNGLIILAGWKAVNEQHPLLQMLSNATESQFTTILAVCVAAGICAPVLEELQFRYVIQGWLSGRLGTSAGFWISSLLFASVHFSIERPDALPLLPFAAILGWMYARYRSLTANITCHATFNLLNISIALAQRSLA